MKYLSFLHLSRVLVCVLIGAAAARADINTINQSVWKMKYGVTDTQMGDANWLNNGDDDGDGVGNGEEIAAGTNPFQAGSVVTITSITTDATQVHLFFPAMKGKQYVVQGSATLSGFAVLSPSVFVNATSDSDRELVAPKGTHKFFRVLVQDIDTDSDGVSDWAENVVGYDPNDATTVGSTSDGVGLPSALANENKVSITATDSTALQPAGIAAPVDVGQVTVTRSGSLHFAAITVPLSKTGTAIEGTDYGALPASVIIPKNSASIVLDVLPTANAGLKTNRVATVTVLPGGGYTLLGPSSASVAINPAGVASGTGLSAVYHNTSHATYGPVGGANNDQLDIYAGTAEMTRTDATVDFSTAVNGWGVVGGPTGLSPVSTNGAFSVRWTGQILPQYSETYTIDFRSDDSAKVWVNGVLLIDRWATQGATDYTNTIALQAGTLYDIQIDYWNSATGTAEAKLYWWSASQIRQIIPQGRLFPAPALSSKFTAITSALTAVGYVSVPFNFSVTSPSIGGATTYLVAPTSAPLPPGLTLNSTTGIISGTPTTAGSSNVAINATNTAAGVITGSSIIDFTIFPTGSVTRETLAGAVITANGSIATIDDDTDYPNNTSRRLRGYIVPPKTGNYYFWLAANNTAEFWLSNDAESINAIRRASVSASTGKKDWNFLDVGTTRPQMTQWLSLVAGQRYYFEVLHNTGTDADDYVALGWCQDDVGTLVSVTGAANGTGTTPSIPDGGALRQGYPYSGTVPSYLCQPYDYPTLASSTGTLYAANLGPQGSSTTQASGSANLRVDASGNSAILHFYYGGLSSPRTNYHLHVDAFATHPAGEIVYDIDDIDSFHPELKTADGGYIWNFENVGTFTSIQQIRDAIALGKVYLNVHTVNYPAGEIRGTLGLVDGSQTPPDPALYAAPSATDVNTNDANAARFLNQASFGASPTDVTYVKANGFEPWLNDQLTRTANRSSNDVVAGLTADINTPYPSSLFTNAWWKQSISGQDQLRQRLAFALSEIMVISWANNSGPLQNNGRLLADYYDQLVDYCLPTAGLADSGNFRGVLKQVTLTPAMGLYLDMRGNQKGDATIGRHPNENYAREINQLFSVGLNRMWDDGRFIIDANANLVPTYVQPSIIGLSKLLTGWTYAQALQASGRLPTNFGPAADYLNAMVLVPTQHELRYEKLLLNNVVSPAATGITPRVTLSSITATSPCVVNTATVHGLKVGDTIVIANVTGGTFSSAINASHQVTEIVDGDSFKVASNCTLAPTAYTNAAVTGATVTPAAISGTGGVIAAITGSQADNAGSTVPHPYDQYGLKEFEVAIDNIVNNDNVPPYICRLLIQRLVTSDPSPGYVYRVVQKFKNNGSGVRGDLAAVVKQILLDGEARSTTAAFANTIFGKQREPMLRVTGPARAFPSINYTGTYEQLAGVNSNKLRIVTTSGVNDFSAGFSLALDFRGNYTTTSPPSPYTNPTSTTYSIVSTTAIAATHLEISAIGATGTTPTSMTCTQPHGMGPNGQTRTIWLFGLSGQFSDASINSGGKTATVTGPNSFTVVASANYVFQVASVSVGSPCTVTTTAPHGLPAGTTTGVTINGVNGGTFSTAINGTTMKVINTGANTFTVTTSADVAVNCTVAPTSYTTWRQSSNPCRVTTVTPHGLVNGDSVTISGVSGGSFTPTIIGTYPVSEVATSAFTLAGVSANAPSTVNTGNIVGANTMEVTATGMTNATYTQTAGSNILTVNTGGPPTNVTVPGTMVTITGIALGNPCTVTTALPHNLVSGGVVSIAAVTDGVFTTAVTGTFVPTVIDGTSFTVPVECTTAATTGTTTKLIRSRVYLDFLTQTTAGGAVLPTDGVMDVLSANGTTSFAFVTADTPVTARGGNVLLPKLTSSYTPITSNTVVQFNNNVNHNMLVGQNVWVDVPAGVASPVIDAEYTITTTSDEDHFTTSKFPANLNGGAYPNISGANNGITIYPLVPPPLGRTGNVVINQSTFNLGSTEATLSQSPLNAPTVFNYFFPDYKFPGTLSNSGIDSPEFQLSTDTNLSNLTNSVTNMFIGTGGSNSNLNGLSSFNNGTGTVVMDIGSYMTTGKTSNAGVPALIDELAYLLIGAPVEATTKTTIQTFVANNTYFPLTTPTPTNLQMRDRVRAIIHLILTSAEFAVQK